MEDTGRTINGASNNSQITYTIDGKSSMWKSVFYYYTIDFFSELILIKSKYLAKINERETNANRNERT